MIYKRGSIKQKKTLALLQQWFGNAKNPFPPMCVFARSEDKFESRRCLISYSIRQIFQTASEKSELSEILQTLSGEFDQSPQQPICQTLSGKRKRVKNIIILYPFFFIKPIPSRQSGINSIRFLHHIQYSLRVFVCDYQ